jgi:hypothetical protein
MLQGTHLMGYRQLSLLSRIFHLPFITFTYPHLSLGILYNVLDHFHTTVTADHMVNPLEGEKYPFPGIGTIEAVAGFITMNYLAVSNAASDWLELDRCLLTSPFHDLIDPTLANRNPM